MIFKPPLKQGMLLRRYKRFLADVVIAGNQTITMHCANTGAMLECSDPDSRIWYSEGKNTRRKYPFSLEVVETKSGALVCVNTARANQLVYEAISNGWLKEFDASFLWRREVTIPDETGRFDLGARGTVIEVKSVTYAKSQRGYFPDTKSERAVRHTRALARCSEKGLRSVLLFCVPHTGINEVTVADDIDPMYGQAVRDAIEAGVEVLAYGCVVSPREIRVVQRLEFLI